MELKKRQKSPFDSQIGVVRSDQESGFSLFRFFSCPGHEETGVERKGLGSSKQHRQSPPKDRGLGGIAMPPYEGMRRRQPMSKALLPWPGFFYFDQYLPNGLLCFQADGFGPLQVASEASGCGILAKLPLNTVAYTSLPIQIGPQKSDNNQCAKGYVG